MIQNPTDKDAELPEILTDFQRIYGFMKATDMAEMFADRVMFKPSHENTYREVLREDIAAYFEGVFSAATARSHLSRVAFEDDSLKILHDKEGTGSFKQHGMLSVNGLFHRVTSGDGILDPTFDEHVHIEISADNVSTNRYPKWQINRFGATPIAATAKPQIP